MDKFARIAGKTGISEEEVKGFSKAGLFGFIAFLLMGLFGCAKNGNKKEPLPQQPAESDVNIPSMQDIAKEFEAERSTAAPAAEKDGCGPYPGYPCGTKYYTVAISDFKSA